MPVSPERHSVIPLDRLSRCRTYAFRLLTCPRLFRCLCHVLFGGTVEDGKTPETRGFKRLLHCERSHIMSLYIRI